MNMLVFILCFIGALIAWFLASSLAGPISLVAWVFLAVCLLLMFFLAFMGGEL